MPDVRVSSWAELHERLFAGSWREPLRRFRSSFAYRGMSDARAQLGTTLSRLGGEYAEQEGHLLRNFRKYAGTEVKVNDEKFVILRESDLLGVVEK